MGEARRIADKFVEAFNAHDAARIRDLQRDDVVFEAPGEVKLTGADAMTEYAMSWLLGGRREIRRPPTSPLASDPG